MISSMKVVKRPFLLLWMALFISVGMMTLWSKVEAATPTLSAPSIAAGVGQTVTVPIVLSEAPSGLSGFDVTVSLSSGNLASITSVDIPDYGMTQVNMISSSQVNLRGLDINFMAQSGTTNVVLGTLTLQTLKRGSSDILIDVLYLDDDRGNSIGAQILPGTLSVKKNAGGPGGSDGGDTGSGGGGGKGGSGGKGGGKKK